MKHKSGSRRNGRCSKGCAYDSRAKGSAFSSHKSSSHDHDSDEGSSSTKSRSNKPDRSSLKTIEGYCSQFTDERIPYVKIGRRYFYDPCNLLDYAKAHKMDPFSVGIFLGEDRNGFSPSSGLIELIAQKSAKKAFVNDKAAWLFVCNRDILMTGVADSNDQEPGSETIVCDVRGNALGVATVFNKFDSKMKNKVFLKHRLDKGEYLRRER